MTDTPTGPLAGVRTGPLAGVRTGPLAGLRVVELAGEWSPMAGKLLGDMGADVILVEPPGGHPTRSYGPFAGDAPDPERSLWWWAYHTSKRGVEIDLADPAGRQSLLGLLDGADILLESEPPGRLDALGLTAEAVTAGRPDLLWVSITPFGRTDPRSLEPATDLTLMAGAGPVWSCGYDDHTLPPVRGEGGQAMNVAGLFAVNAVLVALLARLPEGRGQRLDVSVHAALNVTTEGGTYEWLTMGTTLLRQTGRHASAQPTLPTQQRAADATWVNTGFPPRYLREIEALLGWLAELGLDQGAEGTLLQMAVEQGGIDMSQLRTDPLVAEMFGAGREAMCLIAARLPAIEFFIGAQDRGLAVGIVYSPEAVLEDPHIRARQASTIVPDEELGTEIRYAGPPFVSEVAPYRITRRAPRVGEHRAEWFGPRSDVKRS